MRKIPCIAIALAATSLYGHEYECSDCDLIFQAEYAYLMRAHIGNFVLVKDTTLQNDKRKILDTKSLMKSMGNASAVRGGILYNYSTCSTFELLYTYIYPWHTTKTVTSPASILSFPFRSFRPVNGFINASRAVAKYRSFLQNAEFNYWLHETPQYINYFSFSWDMGLRYMRLDEHFTLSYFKAAEANYTVRTENNLYGIQLGAMLEINPTSYWTWSFQLKGAAFANQAHNHVGVFDPADATAPPGFSKNQLVPTGLVEGYARLAYHMSSFMSVHAGYQGFFLFGLALAPEQKVLNSDRVSHLQKTGEIIIHGVYAGLTIRF